MQPMHADTARVPARRHIVHLDPKPERRRRVRGNRHLARTLPQPALPRQRRTEHALIKRTRSTALADRERRNSRTVVDQPDHHIALRVRPQPALRRNRTRILANPGIRQNRRLNRRQTSRRPNRRQRQRNENNSNRSNNQTREPSWHQHPNPRSTQVLNQPRCLHTSSSKEFTARHTSAGAAGLEPATPSL